MRKTLTALALAAVTPLFLPVSAAHAHDLPGWACDEGDESSYTPAGAKLDRIDRNGNEYICVQVIDKKNGGYRLKYYDDYPAA